MYLLPDTADTIQCIPIISRATANTKFNIAIPNSGVEKIITDMATANTPTPNTNILAPFDTFLEYIPSAILAIPENRRPKDSIIARKPAANNGNVTTVRLNPITNAPRAILPNREDFEWLDKNPVATLSNPTTNRAAASRKDTVPIPTPGYTITQSDNPMAIIPRPLLQCFKELNRLFTRLLIIIDVVYESYLVCK
ncbi:MAG: hypothetical protein WBL88_00975 [Nitrososphaeraceae archaeon]